MHIEGRYYGDNLHSKKPRLNLKTHLNGRLVISDLISGQYGSVIKGSSRSSQVIVYAMYIKILCFLTSCNVISINFLPNVLLD